jgi:hypothetical protein
MLAVVLSFGTAGIASAWGPTTVPWSTAKTDWLGKATGNTQYDPYIISTAEELAGIAKLCHEGNAFTYKHFALAGDIDLGDREWFSIGWFDTGTYTGGTRPFSGAFDGRGYSITGLNSRMGRFGDLFGYIGNSGTVKNLVVDGRSTGSGMGSDGAAILTAWASGRIENCVVSGDVRDARGGRGYIGLVASLGSGANIRNVITYGAADASGSTSYCYAGGIIGYSYSPVSIENCVTYADAIIGGMDAGGIIGGNLGLSTNIYNNASLAKYMSGQYVGGVTALGHSGEGNYWLKEPGNGNQPSYDVSYGGDGVGEGCRETVAQIPVVAAAPVRPITVRAGSTADVTASLHPDGGDRAGLSFVWNSSKAGVAAVSGTNESAVITGVAPGTATVTLTMSNPAWKGTTKKVTSSVYVTVTSAGGGALGLSAYSGDGSVTLGWDAQAGASKYRVQIGGEPWADVSADRTDYTFTGLVNGNSYTFGLEAVFAGSVKSDTITATPAIGQRPPSAPAGFVATAGDRTVTVQWSAPENDGGSPVTGYEVSSGGVDWTPVGDGELGHTFTGLYLGREYEFSVRAVNEMGPGEAALARATLRSGESAVSAEDAVSDGESWRSWLINERGFADGTLKISEEGYLVIEEFSALDAARAASLDVDADGSVTTLPIVDREVDEEGGIAAFYFNIKGSALLAGRPEDVLVMKMLGGGRGELFAYAGSWPECADKRFTVLKRGAVYDGAIEPGGDYVLALFVADGGDFDLQSEAYRVTDPAVILSKKSAGQSPEDPEDPDKPGGGPASSGGGCGALGFAAFPAIIIVSAVLTAGREIKKEGSQLGR